MKSRSIRRKKRKGFHGIPRYEKAKLLANNNTCDKVTMADGCSSLDSSPTNDNLDDLTSRNVANASTKDILDTSFEMIDANCGILTRKKVKELSTSSVTGLIEIQDAALFSESVSNASICRSCRKLDSKLQLFQRNGRGGLPESLFFKCLSCSCETPIKQQLLASEIEG